MENGFDPETGIYTSPRPPVCIPSDPNLSLVTFLFQNNSFSKNDVALIDAETSETLTYHQLKIQVSKLAHALLRLEINKNDVVLVFAPNSIPFIVSFFAVTAVGAVATTCNPAFTLAELSKQVKDCDPKLVVTVPENLDLIAKLNLPAILLKSPDSTNFATKSKFWIYSDLIETSEGVSDLPASTVRQSDVAALFYSSGTTGVSKGVVLTHRNFISSAAMGAAAEWDVEGKNVALCFLPMFHIYGLTAVVYGRLRRGGTVVVVAKFEVEKTLRCVEKYRVTHMYVVPPAMIALAKQSVVKRYDLSSLRLLMSAAAPLGKDLMEECAKNFPLASMIQGYGMTEFCGTISIENPNEGSCPSGSTGKLLPGIEARIIGVDSRKPLPPNEQGEIWLRGPNMTQGYFKNPEATKSTIDDEGWVHTGDLGYFDEKGQLFVVDRLKELIKCYGFQVAPAELEALLLSHPGILEAAVVPYRDAKAGEVPIAFVVCSPSSKLIAEDVQKFIAKQVVPYKRIRKVIFVKNIPKLPSGKILRRQLISEAPSKL